MKICLMRYLHLKWVDAEGREYLSEAEENVTMVIGLVDTVHKRNSTSSMLSQFWCMLLWS